MKIWRKAFSCASGVPSCAPLSSSYRRPRLMTRTGGTNSKLTVEGGKESPLTPTCKCVLQDTTTFFPLQKGRRKGGKMYVGISLSLPFRSSAFLFFFTLSRVLRREPHSVPGGGEENPGGGKGKQKSAEKSPLQGRGKKGKIPRRKTGETSTRRRNSSAKKERRGRHQTFPAAAGGKGGGKKAEESTIVQENHLHFQAAAAAARKEGEERERDGFLLLPSCRRRASLTLPPRAEWSGAGAAEGESRLFRSSRFPSPSRLPRGTLAASERGGRQLLLSLSPPFWTSVRPLPFSRMTEGAAGKST